MCLGEFGYIGPRTLHESSQVSKLYVNNLYFIHSSHCVWYENFQTYSFWLTVVWYKSPVKSIYFQCLVYLLILFHSVFRMLLMTLATVVTDSLTSHPPLKIETSSSFRSVSCPESEPDLFTDMKKDYFSVPILKVRTLWLPLLFIFTIHQLFVPFKPNENLLPSLHFISIFSS